MVALYWTRLLGRAEGTGDWGANKTSTQTAQKMALGASVGVVIYTLLGKPAEQHKSGDGGRSGNYECSAIHFFFLHFVLKMFQILWHRSNVKKKKNYLRSRIQQILHSQY